jgi:hypothetical protein
MSVAKIDVDVKMPPNLFLNWVATRIFVCDFLGYKLKDLKFQHTKKGFHFWFHLEQNLSDRELADLQFLLGDDQSRAKFNFLREEAGIFRAFNCLFSKKVDRRVVVKGGVEAFS